MDETPEDILRQAVEAESSGIKLSDGAKLSDVSKCLSGACEGIKKVTSPKSRGLGE